MDLDPIASALQKKPFDRSAQDVSDLSAWLAAHCGFFNGMPLDAVEAVGQDVGHLSVKEGTYVCKQGQIGDAMYVVIKGYCSVLKTPQIAKCDTVSDGSCTSTGICSRRGTQERATSSCGQPASRRATVEQQIQQFALATGAVSGVPGVCPAGSAATGAVPFAGAAVTQLAGSRRCTSGGLAVPAVSRRATADLVLQKQASEAVHVGWVGQGESFGGAALLNPSKPRQASLLAGDGGVVLLVIDRAGWNRLQTQAQANQGAAAVAVQSVLAAACRPLLVIPPGKRTATDVESLAELLAGLEAFKLLPESVRSGLAKNCQAVQLAAGAVVFKEDQKGDAMYVVMSGTCHIRARPLKPLQQAAALCPTETPALLPNHAAPTASEAATAGSQNSSAVATAAVPAGAAVYSSVGSHSSIRRTTWEGAAFTPQEQARLEAVKAALDADKHLQRLNEQTAAAAAEVNGPPGAHGVEKDGLYWTAKYMHDAAAAATASDPHWGLEGGLTPLAAVFAAKWRQQMRKQQAEQHAQQQHNEDVAAEDRAYAAMEELLGKAAARAWKAARDSSSIKNNSSSHQDPAAAAAAESRKLVTKDGSKEQTPKTAADRPLRTTASFSTTDSSETAHVDKPLQFGPQSTQAPADAGTPALVSTPPSTAASATAAAAGLLAAAAGASDPAESLKLQLAALGVIDPADVSRRLMEEVAARADLNSLLVHVAGILERKGLPKRLSRKGSMKITKEVNQQILRGSSTKFYSPALRQQQHAMTAVREATAGELTQNDGCESPRARQTLVGFAPDAPRTSSGVHRQVSKSMRASGDDYGTDLATEATGMSASCNEWRSSLDGSDAAGLCMSLDAEDDGYGSCISSRVLMGCSQDGAAAGCSLGVDPIACEDLEGLKLIQQTELKPLAAEVCEEAFGPVIRLLGPGESFGELAMLSKNATRTATVVVGSPVNDKAATGQDDAEEGLTEDQQQVVGQQGASSQSTGGNMTAAAGGATLIRISRSCYDLTVRAIQVAALEDLLGLLSGLAPFKSLSRELLTALAVFVRPVQLGQGQLLAVAGQKVEGLIVIQEGEVKLLDTPPGVLSAEAVSNNRTRSSSGGASATAGMQPRSRRATAEDAKRPSYFATCSSSDGGVSSSRGFFRQLSNSAAAGVGDICHNSAGSSGSGGAAAAAATQSILPPCGLGLSASSLGRMQQSSAPLAVLGPGSLIGENVLGYDPEQDPLHAITIAKGYRARQAAAAAAASLTHQATAVAARPCKVLLLCAEALRRFGMRVRAPLAQLAADRKEFLQQRRTAAQETKCTLAQMMSDMKQQLDLVAPAADVRAGSTCNNGMLQHITAGNTGLNVSRSLKSVSTSKMGQVLPGSPGSSAVAQIGTSSGHSLVCQGSPSSSSSGMVPNAAIVAMRRTGSNNYRLSASQWQQQQWQQQAFGELLQPQQVLHQVTAVDVARLRQVVPGAQAPCVSELAAAARTFPIGALSATGAATAGSVSAADDVGGSSALSEPDTSTGGAVMSSSRLRSGASAKGLRTLLVPQNQQQGQQSADALPASPCWTLAPGGRLIGPAAADAVAAAAAAAGKSCVDASGRCERGSR